MAIDMNGLIDGNDLQAALEEVKTYVDENGGGTGGTVDTVVTENSDNLITSGAVFNAINAVLNTEF